MHNIYTSQFFPRNAHIYVYTQEMYPVYRTDTQKLSARTGTNKRVCGSMADVDGDNALK